jgi:hypothetical protein
VFFAVWLVTGVGLLSHMQRFEPRYLEAVTPAIAAAVGIGVAALARNRAPVAAFALVAALALPSAAALSVARQHRSDAGLPSRMSPAQLDRLSRFLAAHDRGARYEVASSSVERVAPLIVRDGRPVLMLASNKGRPLLSRARLAAIVAAGQVRYGLLSQADARGSRDVSAAAGRPARTL